MRNVPEDHLAYTVLIKNENGTSGSGFFLRTEKKLFLITAKHVFFEKGELVVKKIKLICQPKKLSDTGTIEFLINLEKLHVLKHKNADVCAIELGLIKEKTKARSHKLEYHPGVIPSKKQLEIISVSAQKNIKLLKDVLVSNDVFIFGYPTSIGLKNSPQFDYNKPLLRKGVIANIYADKGTIKL